MHNNSEKKLKLAVLQRHLSEGLPESEMHDTSRDDNNEHEIPDIVEERQLDQSDEIELAEMKHTPQMNLQSVEEPLVEASEKVDPMAELVKVL